MFSRILLAALIAPLIVVASGVPASAATMGTQDGNRTQGCDVDWNAASTLNTRLANNDPQYPDLMIGLDGQSVGSYDQGGNIRSVRPVMDDAPGLLTIRHSYAGEIDSTEDDAGDMTDYATDDTTVAWQVILASDEDIADARLTFTAPLGDGWKLSIGSDLSDSGSPFSSYSWDAPALDAMESGPLTWDIDLGSVDAGVGVVLQFDARVEEGRELSANAVSSASLTGTYAAGVEDCRSPSPSSASPPQSEPPSTEEPAPRQTTAAAMQANEAESPPPAATSSQSPAVATGTMPQTGTDSTLPLIRTAAILLAVGSLVLLVAEWRRRFAHGRRRGGSIT